MTEEQILQSQNDTVSEYNKQMGFMNFQKPPFKTDLSNITSKGNQHEQIREYGRDRVTDIPSSSSLHSNQKNELCKVIITIIKQNRNEKNKKKQTEQDTREFQLLKNRKKRNLLGDHESSESENNEYSEIKTKVNDEKSEMDIEYNKEEDDDYKIGPEEDENFVKENEEEQQNQNEKNIGKIQKTKQADLNEKQLNRIQAIREQQQNQMQLQINRLIKSEHEEDSSNRMQNEEGEDKSNIENEINQEDETQQKEYYQQQKYSPSIQRKRKLSDQLQQNNQYQSSLDTTPQRGSNKNTNTQKEDTLDKISRQNSFDRNHPKTEERSQSPHISVEESFEKQQNSTSMKSTSQINRSRKVFDSPQQMPHFKAEHSMDALDGDVDLNRQYQQNIQHHEEQNEMRLICFSLLESYDDIPIDTTIFALSKNDTISLKYIQENEETQKIICQQQFNGKIKELKYLIFKEESIIFILLEDDSLFMWRWQKKENSKLIQQKVFNFDVFVYYQNLFIVVQKGDMHIQVLTMDKKVISNLDNIKPKEDIVGDNCSIQNIVAWGCEEENEQQWYICCNSFNYFWAYSLNLKDKTELSQIESSASQQPFTIKYETFSDDQQEIFKMRLHKNQEDRQEVIGASDSGQLYIFDIKNKQQFYFKTKSQGEKQMQDIQVFHPYNSKYMQKEYEEPKIILCYENFIRIRKYKKLQFPQAMRCATHEVKNSEIIVYYVLNNQDTILKHSITFSS